MRWSTGSLSSHLIQPRQYSSMLTMKVAVGATGSCSSPISQSPLTNLSSVPKLAPCSSLAASRQGEISPYAVIALGLVVAMWFVIFRESLFRCAANARRSPCHVVAKLSENLRGLVGDVGLALVFAHADCGATRAAPRGRRFVL